MLKFNQNNQEFYLAFQIIHQQQFQPWVFQIKKQILNNQLLALGQELKQCKSLEYLQILLRDTELDEQGYNLFSQQLSELENIKTLRYQSDNISNSSFINEISKNQSLQNLLVGPTPLANHQNDEQSMKKLLSMHSLKTLTLHCDDYLSQDITILKNLPEIQLTNLQHLTIRLSNKHFQKLDQKKQFVNLGKHLKSQTVIRNIIIVVHNNNDFEAFLEFFKNQSKAQFYSFNFEFNHWQYDYDDQIEELKLYCMKNLQKAVNLEFIGYKSRM